MAMEDSKRGVMPCAVGWGHHVWLDKDWNVYVAGSDRKADAEGREFYWHVVPNRLAGGRYAELGLKDARPVRAEVPDEFRRWRFPEMVGIAVGDDGSVYQMTRPSYRVGTTHKEARPQGRTARQRAGRTATRRSCGSSNGGPMAPWRGPLARKPM